MKREWTVLDSMSHNHKLQITSFEIHQFKVRSLPLSVTNSNFLKSSIFWSNWVNFVRFAIVKKMHCFIL